MVAGVSTKERENKDTKMNPAPIFPFITIHYVLYHIVVAVELLHFCWAHGVVDWELLLHFYPAFRDGEVRRMHSYLAYRIAD